MSEKNENERKSRKEKYHEARKNLIKGMLFDFDIDKKEITDKAEKINKDLKACTVQDRDKYLKIVIGNLSKYWDEIPREQLTAIAKKIAQF